MKRTLTSAAVLAVLNGVVLTAPTTESVISGDAQISGAFTLGTAKVLAASLTSGALPVRLRFSEITQLH